MSEKPSPQLLSQVGGDHYLHKKIQPIEYMIANNLGYVEGAVVKYVTRWEFKGGVQDLKKARHLLSIYIDHIEKEENGEDTASRY